MRTQLIRLLTGLALCAALRQAAAQGTAFSYSGQLNGNGVPATGSYDFQFSLSSAAGGGAQIGGTIMQTAVGVTNGLFGTTLDFGAAFTGNPTWLGVSVRSNGVGTYTALTPLQQLYPTPYAIFALTASNLSGTLPASQLTGTLPGTILTNFQGPNYQTIGGGLNNTALSTFSTVGGGQGNAAVEDATVGGGSGNYATGYLGTIGGGSGNYANGQATTVGGGSGNVAGTANYATVAGGAANNATGGSAAVGGGSQNYATGTGATVAGGAVNFAGPGTEATVGGGYNNQATNDYATIAGGTGNSASGENSTVGGGYFNVAGANSATVGGGYRNNASNLVSTVGGGTDNTASGYASTIGGGDGNQAVNYYATVPGGYGNFAGGQYSFAAGYGAQATNDGAFVWADSEVETFGSTKTNQFNVRANGGVRFVTGGAGMTLDGAPVFTAGNGASLTVSNLNLNGAFTLALPATVDCTLNFLGSLSTNRLIQADNSFDFFAGVLSGSPALSGANNTGVGALALSSLATGSGNIALGANAGSLLQSGSNNIDIGNPGISSENGVIRIGTPATHTNTYLTGTVFVPVLTVTGGSDLAEPFQISERNQDAPLGAVMVIDDANPGRLMLSRQPYDVRVAGVISGANGIHPGIQMQQQGLLEGGKNVALTGRVYVLAEASNGAIKPGDLLTTSSTPGRAMRASDHVRAQGAILGKAMTGLRDGKGMVLVLVTLQ